MIDMTVMTEYICYYSINGHNYCQREQWKELVRARVGGVSVAGHAH